MVWSLGLASIDRRLTRGEMARSTITTDLRLRGLQQGATVVQQTFNSIQAVEFPGVGTLHGLGLQFEGSQTLLQPHQPLGQGRHRLGEILSGTGDPKGHGFRGHGIGRSLKG